MKNYNNTPRVGILCGLGPDTTSTFYLDLMRYGSSTTRPDTIIHSIPLNLKKEQAYITQGKHKSHYRKMLINSAKSLEAGGADFIVIPCNTVHEFYDEIVAQVNISVIHIISVVAQEVRKRGWTEALLLATTQTLRTKIYQNIFKQQNINLRIPSPADQKNLENLISNLLSRDFNKIKIALSCIQPLIQSPNIILGCTDLQEVLKPSTTIIDSTNELMLHTVKLLTNKE